MFKNGGVSLDNLVDSPITDIVAKRAIEDPFGLAIVDISPDGTGERTWNWQELNYQADALAKLLIDFGVSKGEAVAYQFPNCGEFVVISLAILKVGAICCPIIPIFREREIAFVLRSSKARLYLIPDRYKDRNLMAEKSEMFSSDIARQFRVHDVIVITGHDTSYINHPDAADPSLHVDGSGSNVKWHYFNSVSDLVEAQSSGEENTRSPGVVSVEMLAQLLFTSGTSGEPKGVLQKMETLNRAAIMEINHLGLDCQDRVFVPSPLAHQTGFLYGMWISLILGVPQILQAVWDGTTALEYMGRWKVTFVQAATPFLFDLVAACKDSGTIPGDLRIFVATGAAVPRALAEHATGVLGAAVCGAWGSTETCLGALSSPFDEPSKAWGTDGRPLEGIRLRISDKEGNILPSGEEGQLEVFSPCTFVGYLDHPDWTMEVMTEDGWYRSGDLAVIDEAGFLHLKGRIKDVINRGGEKIPVGEIEELLYSHPSVKDVAIVAMPDQRLGERACAFVVAPKNEFDFESMQNYLEGLKVAKQYWPERLEILEFLPRNATGKVKKFELRARIREIIEKENAV